MSLMHLTKYMETRSICDYFRSSFGFRTIQAIYIKIIQNGENISRKSYNKQTVGQS